MKCIILILLKFYKKTLSSVLHFLAPHWGCRFFPTCSEYGYRAIEKHGIVKGIWKMLKRISRCHPLSKGGYDPV